MKRIKGSQAIITIGIIIIHVVIVSCILHTDIMKIVVNTYDTIVIIMISVMLKKCNGGIKNGQRSV